MEVILLILGTAYGILAYRALELKHQESKARALLQKFVDEAQAGLLDHRPETLEEIYKEAREILGED